jgi:pyruvate dehydrogenase E2 component (dihydrolipoamide acetyltransferase)
MAEVDLTRGAAIVMPKLGLTMSEGLIAEWQVKPGDEVAAGQILFVVETDKISNEIEAPASGRIVSLLVEQGQTVPVGAIVALWTGPAQGSAPPPDVVTGELPAPAELSRSVATPTDDRIRATPFARRLATLGGLALSDIIGTGPRGRIQARDVQARIDRPVSISSPSTRSEKTPVPAPANGQRDLRPLIAARVSRSKAEIPHFYVTADAEFDALAKLRSSLNADPLAPRKLSVTALLAVAVARALSGQPEANAVWRNGVLVTLDRVAIGLAVDTPGGVMAPVVSVTGGLYAFAEAMEGAVERARNGRLCSTDTGEAAIGISNVGMFGVRALTPIIDPDQSFMLGVGAPHLAFRLGDDGTPKPIQQVTFTLACDHRLIDGAAASRLLAEIVAIIEHPLRLVATWN